MREERLELFRIYNDKIDESKKIDENELQRMELPVATQPNIAVLDPAKIWTPGAWGDSAVNAAEHYGKHGKEGCFNFPSLESYLAAAVAFQKEAPFSRTQTQHQDKMGFYWYDKSCDKGTLLVVDGRDGKIATFHCLTNAIAKRYGYEDAIDQIAKKLGESKQLIAQDLGRATLGTSAREEKAEILTTSSPPMELVPLPNQTLTPVIPTTTKPSLMEPVKSLPRSAPSRSNPMTTTSPPADFIPVRNLSSSEEMALASSPQDRRYFGAPWPADDETT